MALGGSKKVSHVVCEVVANDRISNSFYLLRLAAPSIATQCEPGQFILIRGLVSSWPYLRRPFSVYSSDSEAMIEVVYKVIGRATQAMRGMVEGDRFDAIGPLGTSFSPPRDTTIVVAGGIGIPPVAYYCQRYADYGGRMILIVAARDRSELLVPVNLLALGIEIITMTEDGSRGEKGTAIDGLQKALEAVGKPSRIVACGPVGMLRHIARISRQHSISCEISVEERMGCGIGACLGCAVPASSGGYLHACSDGPVLPAEAVDWGRWCET